MSTRLPDGIIPPVITPLSSDLTVDVPALKKLITQIIAGGASALFVNGTVGLGSLLPAAEYEKVIIAALDTAPKGYPILCGVLEPSTLRVAERMKILEALGIELFVAVMPYYMRAADDDALLRHFGYLRDATDMEMVLYNIPVCTGAALPVSAVTDMVKRGWTSGYKDSSGDREYFSAVCRSNVEAGLKVYQGMAPDFAWLDELGASGCVPVPANVYPELFTRGWEQRANSQAIAGIQAEVDQAWDELVKPNDFISATLNTLAGQGIGSGISPFV